MLGRVDRYELLELVGQGSFGGVYRARHVHTGQLVALKLARGTVDPEAAARILSEGRAAASLRHVNVVGVLDGGTTSNGEAFVVMELLEGTTLSALLAREGPLPWHRAAAIAIQILDGLAAAHAAGVVHRDVKPSNVFLTNGDNVKVIDFGISKLRRGPQDIALTIPGIAMGTPGYMAPEQLGDASGVDPRADVYSAGATLFEMLSKKRPIEADTFEEWVRKLSVAPSTPLTIAAPHVPPELASIVDRALARDRDARWPSAQAMREALAASAYLEPATTLSDATFRQPSFGPAAVPPTLTLPLPPAPKPKKSAAPWIIAIVAALVTAAALATLGVAVAFRNHGVESPIAVASSARATPAPPPSPADDDPRPDDPDTPSTPPPSTPAGKPPPVKPTPSAQTSGGLTIGAPQPVGPLKVSAFFALAARARPGIDACNPTGAPKYAKVDLHVTFSKISLVGPSPEDPGDKETAKCIARALSAAAGPTFDGGEHGIYKRATFTWR